MPPPELADDLLGEIFLRLPPDDPACLLRASLACKRWRRILADPAFRRRHRELHRTPSIVGFLRIVEGDAPYAPRFVPNNPASGGRAARDLPGWLMLDCRHGRSLFLTLSSESRPGNKRLVYDFILWDPLTNERRRLPRPSPPPTDNFGPYFNAAVLCAAAAEGCDRRKCHGGPFLVAFVWSRSSGNFHSSFVTSARVYSSETGNWSEPISVQHPNAFLDMMPCPSTLVSLWETRSTSVLALCMPWSTSLVPSAYRSSTGLHRQCSINGSVRLLLKAAVADADADFYERKTLLNGCLILAFVGSRTE